MTEHIQEFREGVKKLVETIDQLKFEGEPITWLKFRIGSSQYWILSKEKPTSKMVAGSAVYIDGEVISGWWLWTY